MDDPQIAQPICRVLWGAAVSCVRLLLIILSMTAVVGSVLGGPGLFNRRKVDPERARLLVEILRTDPDERKRRAAADELGGADARLNADVALVLTAALRKDVAVAVRVQAAESLGRLGVVFPVAGAALEVAAEADPSPLVRLAAKRALWEYHLLGYRSPRGNDFTAQTAEPPIARPGPARPTADIFPSGQSVVFNPALDITPPAFRPIPASADLPIVAVRPGPRLLLPSLLSGPRESTRTLLAIRPPTLLNVTSEPAIAPSPAVPPVTPFPQPFSTTEPPLVNEYNEPEYVPTLPPLIPDLPPLVPPPDLG